MAQFAPVAPIPLAREMKKMGLLGKYHLLLAHDVLEHPESYQEVYDDPEMFLIMDNSVIELKQPLGADKIAAAAELVNADVTVLPDYLLDMHSTLEASFEAVRQYVNEGLMNFMAVPQGRSYKELRRCAWELAELPGVNHWGIGRFIAEDISGTRTDMLEEFAEMRPEFGIHLLGFSDSIGDDIFCAMDPRVKGIDSAVPMRCGLHGIEMTAELESHPPRGDYWETSNEVTDLVKQNVRWFREVIGDKEG